jgi:hypothetical protein
MVAYSLVQRLTPNAALVVAGVLGTLAALVAALLPGGLLEPLVLASGIAAFVPSAEPPLGFTARLCLGVAAGGGTALLAWFALSTLIEFVRRNPALAQRRPSVRRADAHPDAPPREPLRAVRDLGFELGGTAEQEPLDLATIDLPPEPVIAMGAPSPALDPVVADVVVEPLPMPAPPPVVQPLPRDLDQPLASFDPGAVPDVPLAAPRPVAPLRPKPAAPVFEAGERFETFALVPTPAPPAPITGPDTVATVHSLLDRLERGIARRSQAAAAQPTPQPVQGLESTLDQLRRMAVRA